MKREILLRGASQINSDILYFTGIFVPDAFFAFTLKGKKCALINALEFDRAKKTSSLDEVIDSTTLSKKLFPFGGGTEVAILSKVLKKSKVKALLVPSDFPALELELIRAEGFDVKVSRTPIFPERDIKSKREIKEIEKANAVAAKCYANIEQILKDSVIDGNKIFYNGQLVTSQYLRSKIEIISLQEGADALHTIVAGGEQACNPHEVGYGAIRANSLIVMDIFPRLRSSGYFGDMTRTFLKGTANDAQIKLVETVKKAQHNAFKSIADGVNGADIHADVESYFESMGYITECKKGVWGGFFHSTGHGLGLDIHEKVSISPRDCILKVGNVVTVEPGLYYKSLGGCRIEDTVVVEKNKARKLSKFHYNWVIA